MRTGRVTIDLSETIADLREAARYSCGRADVAIERACWAVSGMGCEAAIPDDLCSRLARNIRFGIDHARCMPGVLRGYLLGAAAELEAWAAKQAKDESNGE